MAGVQNAAFAAVETEKKGFESEEMRKTKTIMLPLLGEKKVRIAKSEVSSIEEQLNIEGGIDVEVWMKSGWRYLTTLSKKTLERKIYG